MAWIESHQELRQHPKVLRLARLLDIPRTSAIGMLHLLWWWALDHAEDGDVSDFDAADVAVAMEWEGDPESLLHALIDCGPGGRSGFLERANDRLVLHDWREYAGKLVERRRSDRERKRRERGMSDGRPPDVAETAYVTEPNPTQPNQTPPTERRADVDGLCDLLAELIVGNGGRKPSVTKAWRDEARRLLDRDGIPVDEAERVMRWALADDFWKANILSMPTFRKQYDRLKIKAKASVNGAHNVPRYNT